MTSKTITVRESLLADYSIALLTIGAKCVPYTRDLPIQIDRNPVSLEKVKSSFPVNLRELIMLFWGSHNVNFKIFNFESLSSLHEATYGSNLGSNAPYLYYEESIPIEYPATISARCNSGIISPIWDYASGIRKLPNYASILKLEDES